MSDRRKLIVVSNRGPASFALDEDGKRVARRGGGGLVTALRSLVTQHDVTWIASAMTNEDRAVAERGGGEAIDEVAWDGSPYRLRLVAHDPAAYDWFYNVVANPTLWFLQHYLWALAYAPDIDPRPPPRVGRRLRARERRLRRRRARGAGDGARLGGVLPRLPPVPGAEARPRAAPGHAARPLRSHPLAGAGPMARPAGPIRRAIHEGLLANDVVGFHAERWRLNFMRSCRDLVDGECDFETNVCTYRRRPDAGGGPPDLDRRRRVRGARRERRTSVSERPSSPPGRPEFLVASRRPHGPVEERRPRVQGLRVLPR